MLDSQQGITREEKKIANMIEEQGKGCILLFNKWDLVKGFRMEHCLQGIEEEASFLKHCPKLFMSATTGRNVDKIFELVQQVYLDSKKRITTHQLNKFIAGCLQRNHPPMLQGKRLRIYYMAQVGINPPKFVLFVNYPSLMVESYKKYLYNQFREVYQFAGLPIGIYLKGKKKKAREGHLVDIESEHQRERLAKMNGDSSEEPMENEGKDEDFDEEDFGDFDDDDFDEDFEVDESYLK